MKKILKSLLGITMIFTLISGVKAEEASGYSIMSQVDGCSFNRDASMLTTEWEMASNYFSLNNQGVKLNGFNSPVMVFEKCHNKPVTVELNGKNTIGTFGLSNECKVELKGEGSIEFYVAISTDASLKSISDEDEALTFIKDNIITSGMNVTSLGEGKFKISKEQKQENPVPEKENKELVSNNGITFSSEIILDSSYSLSSEDITDTFSNEVKEKMVANNEKILNIYDISVMDADNQVVPMENGKFKISIKMTDEMKKYKKFKAIYILDNEVKDTMKARVVDNKIVFETTHLSQYGIVGINEVPAPVTLDNIITFVILGIVTLVALAVVIIAIIRLKKKNKKNSKKKLS